MRTTLTAAACAAAIALLATAAAAPAASGGNAASNVTVDARRHAARQRSQLPALRVGPEAAERRADRADKRVVLRGKVGRGAECYILRTPRGDTWSLVGNIPFRPGQQVVVTGRLAKMSFCMQGRGTVEVERMRVIGPTGGRNG